MLSNAKRPSMRKPSSKSDYFGNITSHVANSLQDTTHTCGIIQQECEAKKLAVEQNIENRMAIMLQENIQNADIIRSATSYKIITPSNYQRIGNILGLAQEHIAQLRQEGKTVTDMVRIYTQTRSELLHDVITPLQEIQAKHTDIIQYCNIILRHSGTDREKQSRLQDFMKLSQETLKIKNHRYKEIKALFHKKPGHHAIQKTITGLHH